MRNVDVLLIYPCVRVYSYFLHGLNANNNLLFHLIAQSTTTWNCLVILECYNEMLMFLTQKAMITNSINRIKPALFWTTVWILFIQNLCIYMHIDRFIPYYIGKLSNISHLIKIVYHYSFNNLPIIFEASDSSFLIISTAWW